ncbi:MAG: SEC-C domain-containing protein, partial [Chloroflexi bacterium]|nr:SEC-C domain-containing protein [Chloroflexota bacterium]
HQAVEAKEGVRVQRESITYATVTLQNYFRIYDKLAGMTGTAATEAEEFYKIYKLEVVQVPTNVPMIRADAPDLIFKSEGGKYRAVAEKVAELHRAGRPALVGTVSIEKSEVLADLLKRKGVPHQVLNAKQHEREAGIVAQAGRPGAVTVATNMAGRGTDIILGGNPESLEMSDEEWQQAHDRVVELGGLCIIGTERHESRRIDNQLRGRTGRQGDPGASLFYVSTEDDLIRRFGGDRIKTVMNFVGLDEDTPIENRMVSSAVESAQSRVEGTHFEVRKHLVDYDDVVNTHRDVIYKLRKKVIHGEELRPEIAAMVQEALAGIVAERLQGDPMNWDVEGFQRDVTQIMPLPEDLESPDEMAGMEPQGIEETLVSEAEALYDERERLFTPEVMRQLEQAVMLQTIDTQWVEHLTAMENMRQGIGLEAAGQRDPLVQYKRAGYDMFSGLMDRINRDVVHTIFRVALQQQPETRERGGPAEARRPVAAGATARVSAMASQGTAVSAVAERHGGRSAAGSGKQKIGRNDPCPCGSGKKYKRCCGAR